MNNLSLHDSAMKDPFESVFRGFVAPMRMPGVKKEDIKVRIDVNRVHIDAEAMAKYEDRVLSLDLHQKAGTSAKKLAIQ